MSESSKAIGTVQRLAADLLHQLEGLDDRERLLVGVSGIPGSGKTTLASQLAAALNFRTPTICVSLDGWHYSRAELDTFPDAKDAHRRRGAAFTFDAAAFAACLKLLRQPVDIEGGEILAPSFSHELKDPTADAIRVDYHHRIVILEGLYLLLDKEPWRDAAQLLDERWFIDCPRAVAKERLVKRHVETGVAVDAEAAAFRAEDSDLVNGDEILAHLVTPTRRIPYEELLSSTV